MYDRLKTAKAIEIGLGHPCMGTTQREAIQHLLLQGLILRHEDTSNV